MQHDIAAPFRKSSHSGPTNDCVEVAPTALSGAAIRDSKDHMVGMLQADRRAWSALIGKLKHA